MINRTDQAVEVIRQIGEPNVAIHLDTFHMHIEERDLAGAVRHAAGQLCHVHLVESDRGPLGGGGIDWTAFLDALSDANYTGLIGLEMLCDDLLAPNCSWSATPVGNDDSRIGQSLNTLRRMIEPYREPPGPGERT
jgi:sugar phosphate isomerase/epimerase